MVVVEEEEEEEEEDEKKKKPGFDPQTIQPTASHYTNYATWPILKFIQKY